MKDTQDGMDENYWREFRARAHKRTNRQMALLIAPAGIGIAAIKILEPMNYPNGDLRNSMEFRLVVYGLCIAFLVALIIASVRWLWADRHRPN